MTNVPYNTNIPFASNSPSQDQPRMQENTNSLKSLIEFDHIGFGDNQGGYHKDVHQPVLPIGGQTAWDPVIGSVARLAVEATKIAGVQQLFPLNYTPDTTGGTADTQLFSLTGNGGISQFTGSASTSVDEGDGWCWVGGVLIQWGKTITPSSGTFTSGTATGNVAFKDRFVGAIPFPNKCFVVNTVLRAGGNTGSGSASVTFMDKDSFSWVFKGQSANFTGIFWIAIGN